MPLEEKPCCSNCTLCHKQVMWSVVRYMCGDPTEAAYHETTPESCCINHTPSGTAHIDFGLTMDIWY